MIVNIYVIGIPIWAVVFPIWFARDDKIESSGALFIGLTAIFAAIFWPFTITLGVMVAYSKKLLGE